MVLKALEETGTATADALMIGDTSYDMAMGRAAGVRTIGVTWGYHKPEELRASGAERLVDTYEELMAVLASGRCWD
jgi:phosphoglycolate phosphatase